MSPKFTVAIVGAGLTGLMFAHALRRLAPDVEFEVYEGATQLDVIGAGIGLQRRSWGIIQALGLVDALGKIAGDGTSKMITTVHRKSDQAEGIDFNKFDLMERNFSFHRAEIQRTMIEELGPNHAVHLGKRLVSYSQNKDGNPEADKRIQVTFQDGTTTECDVLVGADGIRSGVRAIMYRRFADTAQAQGKEEEAANLRKCIPPVFSGEVVYRCLIEKEKLSAEEIAASPAMNGPTMWLYCGKNKHVITYPISQGKVINVGCGVTLPGKAGTIYDGPLSARVNQAEIVKNYKGWEPQVQRLLDHIDGGLMWVINVVNDLPTFVDGNVALMGDAAHAMGHHLGAGAGQGFEGALLLAQFLSRPSVTKQTLPIALKMYDEVRRPFVQRVVGLSRRASEFHHLNGPELADLTEESSMYGEGLSIERLEEIGKMIEETRAWRDRGLGVLAENEVSLKRLDEALAEATLTPA